jgi:hypothetical protein
VHRITPFPWMWIDVMDNIRLVFISVKLCL